MTCLAFLWQRASHQRTLRGNLTGVSFPHHPWGQSNSLAALRFLGSLRQRRPAGLPDQRPRSFSGMGGGGQSLRSQGRGGRFCRGHPVSHSQPLTLEQARREGLRPGLSPPGQPFPATAGHHIEETRAPLELGALCPPPVSRGSRARARAHPHPRLYRCLRASSSGLSGLS